MPLFSTLDTVDWASLQHAYGAAHDVPEILRGLVSADDGEREVALDAMYGGVHHQGDIYDSTVAAVPFLLEAVAWPGLPGRADILTLLSSIADSALERRESGDELSRAALRAVQKGAPRIIELLTDPDVEIRKAAPGALACLLLDASVTTKLEQLLTRETDSEARSSLFEANSTLLSRTGRKAELLSWLTALTEPPHPPDLRVMAMSSLFQQGVDAPSAQSLGRAISLLGELYSGGSSATVLPGAGTDTLIGVHRRLLAEAAEGRRAPQARVLVGSLSASLGDHVEARAHVLLTLLRSNDWEQQHDAIGAFSNLIGRWRGDYREAAELLGQHLTHGPARSIEETARLLRDMFELAIPAADGLVHSLELAAREGSSALIGAHPSWVVDWRGDGRRTMGDTLLALARTRDQRALPMLEWVLEQPKLAVDVGYAVAELGVAGRALGPHVARHLARLSSEQRPSTACYGFVYAARALKLNESNVVDSLVRLSPSITPALEALGELGEAARQAVPQIRSLLDHSDPRTAIAAASALHDIAPEPSLASKVAEMLEERGAIAALSKMGTAAIPFLPMVRGRLADAPVEVAQALWRLSGDVGEALEPLREAWERNPHCRRDVARLLGEMGPHSAPLLDLIDSELARARRHNASDSAWSSHQVKEDEELLRLCREARARIAR